MKFTKMQGIGNDYVYINCFEEKVEDPVRLAKLVSDRHFGMGSDGLILIKPSRIADCRMEMFNADGSQSQMCGNGIRCVGKFVYDHGLVKKESFTVETGAGVKNLTLKVKDGKAQLITVDMGIPEITSEVPEAITINGTEYEFVGISVGNPHAVYFMDQIDSLDLEAVGSYFETHERFPERTNSEFVQVIDSTHLKMRVWERGSGETWACGTGASACTVAAILRGYIENEAEVQLRGGNLMIHWDRTTNHIYMTGPAVEVYRGDFDIKDLQEEKHV